MNHITLYDLLAAKEGENLEFKEKKRRFDFEELVKYACAIANCGGGHIVFTRIKILKDVEEESKSLISQIDDINDVAKEASAP